MSSWDKAYRQEITERVIEALKKGTAPWMRPWSYGCAPQNATSKRPYNGINTVILSLIGLEIDGGWDPRWCSFKQAKDKGWNVKKGIHGTRITFWKTLGALVEDADGQPILSESGTPLVKAIPFCKYFTVFHASQIDNIPAYVPDSINIIEANEKAERILADSGADIRFGGDRAFYSPSGDFIQLPRKEYFTDTAGYYAVALHELSHWTGAASRLDRDMSGIKGSPSYAREELVAEMAGMFLSSETGVPQTEEHFQQSAAYIASWIDILSSDPNALFRAAADAGRVADFLLTKEREREAAKGQADAA